MTRKVATNQAFLMTIKRDIERYCYPAVIGHTTCPSIVSLALNETI